MGRPSIFTDGLADELCAQIAEGLSLRSICRKDEMPGLRTVMTWLREKEAFRQQYAAARDAQADALFEEAFDIADDASNDWMKREGKDGQLSWVENGETIQRSRLRVDLRKWAAGKLAPKKYGDRVTNEHVGKDDGPIQFTDEARVRALTAFLERTGAKG